METIITGIIWVLPQGSLLWYQQMSGWALYMDSINEVPLVGFRAVLLVPVSFFWEGGRLATGTSIWKELAFGQAEDVISSPLRGSRAQGLAGSLEPADPVC